MFLIIISTKVSI